MRKITHSINITPDGFCDHRAVIADDEMHDFFNSLMMQADTILFGRVTYEMMESAWPEVAKNKSGSKEEIEFAEMMDDMQKIVFSTTLKKVEWKNTILMPELTKEFIMDLKQKPGKAIMTGSPSIMDQLSAFGLIDEYKFIMHPMLAGDGKRFFEKTRLPEHLHLKLTGTKAFQSGAFGLFYEVER